MEEPVHKVYKWNLPKEATKQTELNEHFSPFAPPKGEEILSPKNN